MALQKEKVLLWAAALKKPDFLQIPCAVSIKHPSTSTFLATSHAPVLVSQPSVFPCNGPSDHVITSAKFFQVIIEKKKKIMSRKNIVQPDSSSDLIA